MVNTESNKPPESRACTEKDVENFKENLVLAERYMKTYYPYNISQSHDPIGTHCISFGLGDKTEDLYNNFCDFRYSHNQEQAHEQICNYWELTPKLFQITTGILDHLKNELSAIEYNNLTSNLEVAEKYFYNYVGYVMPNHMQ